MELKEIIEKCNEENREAQKKLYELFAPRMFAVCLQYSKNKADAEDFLHEGFIKVYEKISQFKHKGSFEGWMRRIIVNTILEEFRKNSKQIWLDESHLPIMEEENNTDKTATPELQDIMRWISNLPEQYRMVFNLYVLEDLSHQEISKQLGISVGTSKSNLSRARQWLQNHIKDEEQEKQNKQKIKLWQD